MRRLTARRGLLAGLAIIGLACDRQPATQRAEPPPTIHRRTTWSLEEGDDATIVKPRRDEGVLLEDVRDLVFLTEGTKVRFLSGHQDGSARIRVLEGPASGMVGKVHRLELKPMPATEAARGKPQR